MQHGHKVLILNKGQSIDKTLVDDLNASGYATQFCATVEDFRFQMTKNDVDFVIMETTAEGNDCFFMLQEIRSMEGLRSLPLVVILNKEDVLVKINALKMGADDVLSRPLRFEELYLKMRVLFRRAANTQMKTDHIVYKNIKLSPMSGQVFIGEDLLPFTETEFKVLLALILEKGRPVRRESLAFRTLSPRNKSVRTIDVHINSIRNKLGNMGDHIKTLRGRGYMLLDEGSGIELN